MIFSAQGHSTPRYYQFTNIYIHYQTVRLFSTSAISSKTRHCLSPLFRLWSKLAWCSSAISYEIWHNSQNPLSAGPVGTTTIFSLSGLVRKQCSGTGAKGQHVSPLTLGREKCSLIFSGKYLNTGRNLPQSSLTTIIRLRFGFSMGLSGDTFFGASKTHGICVRVTTRGDFVSNPTSFEPRPPLICGIENAVESVMTMSAKYAEPVQMVAPTRIIADAVTL